MNSVIRTEAWQNRRQFMHASVAVAAGSLAANTLAAPANKPETQISNPLCVFTKPFNSLSFDELADRIAELGFDGIEAPIRKGGHIEPEKVTEELPALVEALNKRKLEITVLTSDINDPDDPLTERVLRTAATLGIKRYRMKYFKYDLNGDIFSQIEQWRPKLKQLAAMNHDFGITAVYQNHAGSNYLGRSPMGSETCVEGHQPGGHWSCIRHTSCNGRRRHELASHVQDDPTLHRHRLRQGLCLERRRQEACERFTWQRSC